MKFPVLFAIMTIAVLVVFVAYYIRAMRPRPNTLEWIAMAEPPGAMHLAVRRHPMTRQDILPLLILCVVYAVTAFFQLGTSVAPQSFHSFPKEGVDKTATFILPEGISFAKVLYYPGLNTGSYTLEASQDGQLWSPIVTLEQDGVSMFKWREAEFDGQTVRATQLRITAHPDREWIELGEVALLDESGQVIDMTKASAISVYSAAPPARTLFDEQETVPAHISWRNSTYFDEIYHARTAYENIRGVYPYEVTHPPLGKLILSLGISLFGMSPFGWRFMGTLFGVLMLPLLYILIKNMFGKTPLALCGTALFTFDFMHLTQTRIATIDTYTVFFILAAYLFFYRWLTVPPGSSFLRYAIPLSLSGLSFGIGVACKWPVLYAGAGLAALYVVALIFLWRDWPHGAHAPRFLGFLLKTLALSLLCFVVVPAIIYCASYLPYAAARGDTSLSNLMKIALDNQSYMLSYHSGVTEAHPYSSRWYEWLVNARPILYYREDIAAPVPWLTSLYEAANGFVASLGDGVLPEQRFKALFASFQNPIVAWGGLISIVIAAVQMVRRRAGIALFIIIGYLAQLLPWVLIGRITFAYHYFPSVIFLVLAVCYVWNDLMERGAKGWRLSVYGLTAGAAGLYAAFYPVLIGLSVPTWYSEYLLKWLPAWPL